MKKLQAFKFEMMPDGAQQRTMHQFAGACGHVHKDNRMSQSNFTCVACGHHEHADVNAAKNSLARGHRVFACGGHIRQPKPRASVAGPTK
jgi:hypothetical protein